MKITLRRANALQNSLVELLKAIKIELTIDVNEFENIEEVLNKSIERVYKTDSRREQITKALYQIREKVGTLNATSGISKLLSEAAYIDKRISQLEDCAKSNEMVNIEVLKGKIDKIKNLKDEAKSRLIGYGDTVTTPILNKEQIQEFKKHILNLKKDKQRINDMILELNVKTEFDLDKETVELLVAEDLI